MPIQYITSLSSTDIISDDLHDLPKFSSSQNALSTCLWICYNDFIESTYLWSQQYTPLANFIQYFFCFNAKDLSMLFKTLFPQEPIVINPLQNFAYAISSLYQVAVLKFPTQIDVTFPSLN